MSLPITHVPIINRFSRRDSNDIRLGEIIHYVEMDLPKINRGDICIIGFPEDRGVERNFGRVGASKAPDIIRNMLQKLPSSNMEKNIPNFSDHLTIYDFGNITIGENLLESQHNLGRVIAYVLHHGGFPIVMGGGHETAFGHFLGYVEVRKNLSIINFDAHLDMRILPADGIGNSGTPFREIVEHPSGLIDQYSVFGLQPHSNSANYIEYAKSNQVKLEWLTDFNHHAKNYLVSDFIFEKDEHVYLTIDIDGFRSSDAPGSSAAQPSGFSATDVLPLIYDLSLHNKSTSLDICEINPAFDRDNQTSKLGALLIYQFISAKCAAKTV